MSRNRPRWNWLVIAAAVAAATAGMRAGAQLEGGFHPPQIGLALRPDYVRRDIHAFVEELGLLDDQRTVLESLFTDYEQAFRAAAEVVRDDLSEIRPQRPADVRQNRQRQREIIEELRRLREEAGPDMDPQELRDLMRQRAEELRAEFGSSIGVQIDPADLGRMSQEMNRRLAAWSAEKDALRQRFESDVRDIVLTDEQRGRWPALERRLRREKTLSRGRLSGESVNLLSLARDLDLTDADREAIGRQLDEYQVALDEALQRRNAYLDASEKDLGRAAQVPDLKLVSSVHERRAGLHRAVRDVNDAYAESIAEALGGRAGAAFRGRYLAEGYPRVFRRTAAERVLNAARELDGLDDATLARLDELKAALLGELETSNTRLLHVVRQHEPERLADLAVRREARLRGMEPAADPGDDPIHRAMQQRSALGQRYLDQLPGLLTPEQLARLPEYGRPPAAQANEAGPDDEETGEATAGSPLERYDADGDGRLDAAEIEAMRRALSEEEE